MAMSVEGQTDIKPRHKITSMCHKKYGMVNKKKKDAKVVLQFCFKYFAKIT